MLQLIFEIIFWLSLLAIIHSYIGYPIFLYIKSKNKNIDFDAYQLHDKLPFVSIIMSVHNEEQVIKEKINSILDTNYPKYLYEIIVGSDASTDKTNSILEKFSSDENHIFLEKNNERKGKINTVNNLMHKAKGAILLLSDADIIFTKNTIFELVKYFKEEKIGLIDSNLQKQNPRKKGVAIQEKFYMNYEILIKNREGIIAGVMMGPFGGAYALRKNLYAPVPKNFLVDDFYINMKVLEKGIWCINNLKAIVYDNTSGNIQDEFKRKIRISTGNFQNLKQFSSILFSKNRLLAFSFFSHKVLRWFVPIFILLIILSTVFLLNYGLFYQVFAVMLFFSLIIPIIDYLLRKYGIHIILLRFISHYYYMNLGLFIGLLKYIKGVKTNVWEPTKRESNV